MNKKLLAIAVSTTLAGIGTAQADTANVNVYGKFYPQLQVSKVTGSVDPTRDQPNTTAVNSQNSYIGFKGEVDVGGGTKGWYQVEQAIEIDSGNSDATFSNRNSGVGLEGGFGNVFLGHWDTVYKQLGHYTGMLGLSSGNFVSSSNILSRFGFGSSRRSRFHERASNWIEYDTPEISGFQFLVGYSPDEDKSDPDVGANDNTTVPVATANTNLVSFGGKWEAGPLYVALAHEVHKDFFALSTAGSGANAGGAGTSSKDQATRLSLGYKLGKSTKVGLDYAMMKWEETGRAAGFSEYKQNTWELSVEHKTGPWGLSASYVNSAEGDCTLVTGGACSTTGFGANMINLAALYSFSKRLGVFGLLSKLSNDDAARHSNIALSVREGGDTTAMAAGVLLRF